MCEKSKNGLELRGGNRGKGRSEQHEKSIVDIRGRKDGDT